MYKAAKPKYQKLQKPLKDQPVEWGIHASEGITWGQVDSDYIKKLLKAKREDAAMEIEALEDELQRRELIEEAELPMAIQITRHGYLPLSLKFHPDRPGGSDKKMRELNAANEWIKALIAAQQVIP
jgi:hypothetical protein